MLGEWRRKNAGGWRKRSGRGVKREDEVGRYVGMEDGQVYVGVKRDGQVKCMFVAEQIRC